MIHVPDLTRAARAAKKIHDRLDAHSRRPPSLRRRGRVVVTLPAEDWQALLREAGR